jgi:Domain of unknown function (DUF6438)
LFEGAHVATISAEDFMRAPLFCGSSRVIALASIVAAAGCASTRASGPAVDDALACRPEALIQLRSDGCDSGRCPVYGVSIFADGSVVYRGGANVAFIGQRRSKIPEANVATLVTALEKMDFIDTPEHCCDCPDASDDPKAAKLVIDYRPGGVEKEIVVDDRCAAVPDVVRGLTGQIQAMTSIATFIAPPTTPANPTTRLASEAPPTP